MNKTAKTESNSYIAVPTSISRKNGICSSAKLLYGEISRLSEQLGYCWASNKYFKELYNVSLRTIQRWIDELVNHGLIVKEITYADDQKTVLKRCLKLPNGVKTQSIQCGIPQKEVNTLTQNNDIFITTPDKIVNNPHVNNDTYKYSINKDILLSSSLNNEDDDKIQNKVDYFVEILHERLDREYKNNFKTETDSLKRFIDWITLKSFHNINNTQVSLPTILEALQPVTPQLFYTEYEKLHSSTINQKESYLLSCLYNKLTSGITHTIPPPTNPPNTLFKNIPPEEV